MKVRGLFLHCKPCMARFKATGVNPQLHFECRCIYLPFNFG